MEKRRSSQAIPVGWKSHEISATNGKSSDGIFFHNKNCRITEKPLPTTTEDPLKMIDDALAKWGGSQHREKFLKSKRSPT